MLKIIAHRDEFLIFLFTELVNAILMEPTLIENIK